MSIGKNYTEAISPSYKQAPALTTTDILQADAGVRSRDHVGRTSGNNQCSPVEIGLQFLFQILPNVEMLVSLQLRYLQALS